MRSRVGLKAIILAAGEGTRLRPYTSDRPKCLVEVDGLSLLDRQLAVLATEAIHPVVLIGGYRVEMLKRPDIELKINPRYAETNMVWTLFCAEDALEDEVLICYGDIVYSREVLQAVLKSKADISVVIDLEWESYWRLRNEDPLEDAETLKMHADGRIYEIGQRPNSIHEIEGQYMGLIKLSGSGVEAFKHIFHDAQKNGTLLGKPIEKAYMTDLIQAVINFGYQVQSVPVRGGWVEVDTVDDLLAAVTKERLIQIESSTR